MWGRNLDLTLILLVAGCMLDLLVECKRGWHWQALIWGRNLDLILILLVAVDLLVEYKRGWQACRRLGYCSDLDTVVALQDC